MIKCKATIDFDLKDFDKLKNIVRKRKEQYGKLYEGDTFECDKEMADYLLGANAKNKTVVKVIEVIPEKVEEPKEEIKIEKPKKSKRKKIARNNLAFYREIV